MKSGCFPLTITCRLNGGAVPVGRSPLLGEGVVLHQHRRDVVIKIFDRERHVDVDLVGERVGYFEIDVESPRANALPAGDVDFLGESISGVEKLKIVVRSRTLPARHPGFFMSNCHSTRQYYCDDRQGQHPIRVHRSLQRKTGKDKTIESTPRMILVEIVEVKRRKGKPINRGRWP